MNVGGKSQTVLNFAKNIIKNRQNISKKKYGKNYPLKQSMNITLYNKAAK